MFDMLPHLRNKVYLSISLLFSFYINECTKEISNMQTGCQLSFQKSNMIGYVDDLYLFLLHQRNAYKY